MKVYVVGGALHYASFIKDSIVVDNINDAQVVLFTGGEDIDPSLYGCKKHITTFSNLKRDLYEKKVFESVRTDQLCVGVCRGSQLMSVLNGGLLVQDCSNHALMHTHSISNGREVYQITSTHHQMQYPFNLDESQYDILYTADNLSTYYEGDKINPDIIWSIGEPEVVLYHKESLPKCLAIQGHPEMMPISPVSIMLSNLINNIVNGIS